MQTSEKVISTFFFYLFSIIDIFELEIFYNIYCANIYVTMWAYILYIMLNSKYICNQQSIFVSVISQFTYNA